MSKPTPKKPSPYDKLSEKNKIVFLAGVFEGEVVLVFGQSGKLENI